MDKLILLNSLLPPKSIPLIQQFIAESGVLFTVSRPRSSKLGDYRAPLKGFPHRISVNKNLNPYAFLITTVHEFAHLHAWNQYQKTVQAHGKEWKLIFRKLLIPFIEMGIFPGEISRALTKHLKRPAACTGQDIHLMQALMHYDAPTHNIIHLQALPVATLFLFKEQVYQLIKPLRKRYRCIHLASKKLYSFHALTPVLPQQPEKTANKPPLQVLI